MSFIPFCGGCYFCVRGEPHLCNDPFRWLGGIQPAADAVGFDRIVIRPQVVSGLKWVKCSHRSIRGRIESNWSTTDAGVSFEFVIPPDTTAILELPARAADELSEGGRLVAEACGIKKLSSGPAVHRLQVGSGRYQFSLRRNRTHPDDTKDGRTSAVTNRLVWPSRIPADCPFPRSTGT